MTNALVLILLLSGPGGLAPRALPELAEPSPKAAELPPRGAGWLAGGTLGGLATASTVAVLVTNNDQVWGTHLSPGGLFAAQLATQASCLVIGGLAGFGLGWLARDSVIARVGTILLDALILPSLALDLFVANYHAGP